MNTKPSALADGGIPDFSEEHPEFLAELLNLPIWPEEENLPWGETDPFAKKLLHYEQRHFFVHCEADDPSRRDRVFITAKTDLGAVSQIVDFYLASPEIHLCDSARIEDRLKSYELAPAPREENEAGSYLRELIDAAVARKASDVHLEENERERKARLRINGVLSDYMPLVPIPPELVNKIKISAKMDIAVRRKSQDGHFEFLGTQGDKCDIRVSSVPGIHGEKLVLRVLNLNGRNVSFRHLNLPPEFVERLREIARSMKGWIVLAGSTGSGKTTTLYGLIAELSRLPINVMTIEEPVEYYFRNITQVEVNEMAGVNFSNCLRSFMRQDPDVIMVGEIRDEETAVLACKAAMTGHLILSTIHAGSCGEVVTRLRSLNVPEEDLRLTLRLVATQELVKVPCRCSRDRQCPICFGTGVSRRLPKIDFLESDKGLFDSGDFSEKGEGNFAPTR